MPPGENGLVATIKNGAGKAGAPAMAAGAAAAVGVAGGLVLEEPAGGQGCSVCRSRDRWAGRCPTWT